MISSFNPEMGGTASSIIELLEFYTSVLPQVIDSLDWSLILPMDIAYTIAKFIVLDKKKGDSVECLGMYALIVNTRLDIQQI